MDLPDTTAITAAFAFIDDVWTAIPMLSILFALVATWKIGPFVLRKVLGAIPG